MLAVMVARGDGKTYRVWEDSNSWGAARWRVLVIRNGVLRLFWQDANLAYSRNIPAFFETSAPLRLRFDVRAKEWLGSDHAAFAFEPGDRVIAIYDVPPTIEANRDAVFNGVLSAMWDVPE